MECPRQKDMGRFLFNGGVERNITKMMITTGCEDYV